MFADYARAFFEDRDVSPGTAHKKLTIERNLAAEFGMRKLSDISPQYVRTFTKRMSAERSRQYTTDHLGLLHMIFVRAFIDGLIRQTPVVGIKLPRKPKPRGQPVALDDVLSIVDSTDQRYRVLVLTIYGTCIRIGEALAIRVSDLGSTGTLTMERTVSKDKDGKPVVISSPKSHARNRTITLSRSLMAELKRHVLEGGMRGEDRLFPSPKRKLLPPHRLSTRYWKPAVDDTGISGALLHGLRHLHASILIDAGRPLPEIAARLGHADPNVTLSTYAHFMDTDDSGSAEAVPDLGAAVGE